MPRGSGGGTPGTCHTLTCWAATAGWWGRRRALTLPVGRRCLPRGRLARQRHRHAPLLPAPPFAAARPTMTRALLLAALLALAASAHGRRLFNSSAFERRSDDPYTMFVMLAEGAQLDPKGKSGDKFTLTLDATTPLVFTFKDRPRRAPAYRLPTAHWEASRCLRMPTAAHIALVDRPSRVACRAPPPHAPLPPPAPRSPQPRDGRRQARHLPRELLLCQEQPPQRRAHRLNRRRQQVRCPPATRTSWAAGPVIASHGWCSRPPPCRPATRPRLPLTGNPPCRARVCAARRSGRWPS